MKKIQFVNVTMSKEQTFKIKRFDMSTLQNDATLLVVAKRRSGKSVLVRDIMYHKRKDIRAGVVINGSESVNPFYRDFVPDTYIYDTYDAETMERILTSQKMLLRKHNFKKSYENNLFVIMDDTLADAKAFKRDPSLRTLLMNGRHFNIFYISVLQYALGLEPALRSNFDYVFIFSEANGASRKKLWENFAGMITYKEFSRLMDTLTEDYSCMVINNTSTSSKVEDRIFFYKARIEMPKFRVGDDAYWLEHDRKYNQNYEDESLVKPMNTKSIVSAYAPDRQSVRIIIKK